MKKYIVVMMVMLTISALAAFEFYKPGQTITKHRTLTISNQLFIVQYEYRPDISWVPATYPPGHSHYTARISVFEAKQIGSVMDGSYVEEGCFEDRPEDHVKKPRVGDD